MADVPEVCLFHKVLLALQESSQFLAAILCLLVARGTQVHTVAPDNKDRHKTH